MAWEDIPDKMTQLDGLKYAQENASTKIVKFFTDGRSSDYQDVPEPLRQGFEARLDYEIGACINLEKSRAWPGLGRK